MKKIFQLSIAVVICLFTISITSAQVPDTLKSTTYLLPDGTVFSIDKLDSLNKAWGDGRVIFSHNKEDDENNIIRLVRMTDEMKQQHQQEENERKQVLAGMLDKPAPDFSVTEISGNRWSLSALRGKIVVLNFWFTSCSPCIRELPELNQLVLANKDKDVVFLGLTYNDAELVNAFLQKRKFNYTIIPNSSAVDKAFHVTAWPTSIVIDQNGIIKSITGSSLCILDDLSASINALR